MHDHDRQGRSVHGNVEDDTDGSNNSWAFVDIMNGSEGENGEKREEDELWEEAKEEGEPPGAMRVEEEEGDIDHLNHTSSTIDAHH